MKTVLRALIERSGFRISRVGHSAAGRPAFYTVSATCQIPDLSFLFELFFGRRRSGVFVEVGAFDGETFSNTSGLADAGWQGLYLEPVSAFADACRRRNARNPNVTVHQVAIGASQGQVPITIGAEFSTVDSEQLAEYQRLSWARGSFRSPATALVRQTTLNAFLAEAGLEPGFDLLVVDVEGYEGEVFAGFDLAGWRPGLLIVELADTHPDLQLRRDRDAALSLAIQRQGYSIVFKDAINTVFVEASLARRAYHLD